MTIPSTRLQSTNVLTFIRVKYYGALTVISTRNKITEHFVRESDVKFDVALVSNARESRTGEYQFCVLCACLLIIDCTFVHRQYILPRRLT